MSIYPAVKGRGGERGGAAGGSPGPGGAPAGGVTPTRRRAAVARAAAAGPAASWVPSPAVRTSIWLHGAALPAFVAAPSAWPWLLGALAANHALLGAVGMRPRSALLGPNLSRLPPACARRGEVALTFDDGPDPEVTPRVLDLLDAAGATASFFLIGARAARHPALVREILRRGHSAENHTHDHPLAFAALHPPAQRRQILRAQETILAAGGRPRFFRAPAGLRSPLLDPVLAVTGLRYVSWTRRGADAVISCPERVGRRLLRGLAGGDLLLLHDGNARRGANRRPAVLDALPRLLTALDSAGLRGVSLPRALDGAAASDAAAAAAAGGGSLPSAAGASR